MGSQDFGDDPDPIGILLATLQIQRTWTPAERRQRLTGDSAEEPYVVPTIGRIVSANDPRDPVA